jgi:tetratricopeptide (TPR) repeat protein
MGRKICYGFFLILEIFIIVVAGQQIDRDWARNGDYYYLHGKYDIAIQYYDKAIEIDKDNFEALDSKGCALAALGRYAEAIQCFDEALKIKPDYFNSVYNKGLALRNSNSNDEAEKAFEKARALYGVTLSSNHLLDITSKIEEKIPLSIAESKIWKFIKFWTDLNMAFEIGNEVNKHVVLIPEYLENSAGVKDEGKKTGFSVGFAQGIEDGKKGHKESDPVKKYAGSYLNKDNFVQTQIELMDDLEHKEGFKEGFPIGYVEGNIIGRGIFVSLDINPSSINLPKQNVIITVEATRSDGKPLDDADVKLSFYGTNETILPFETASGKTDSEGKFIYSYTYSQMVIGSEFCTPICIVAKVEKYFIEKTARITMNCDSQKIKLYIKSDKKYLPLQDGTLKLIAIAKGSDGQPIDKTAIDITASCVGYGGKIYPSSIQGDTDINGLFTYSFNYMAPSSELSSGSESINFIVKGSKYGIEADGALTVFVGVDPDYLYRLGSRLIREENYEEAVQYLDQATILDPNLYGAWINKGLALRFLGRIDESLECFEKAIVTNSQGPIAWYNKATLLGMMGKYEDAIQCYDKALELDSVQNSENKIMISEIWHNKGLALMKLNRDAEAQTAFDTAENLGLVNTNLSGPVVGWINLENPDDTILTKASRTTDAYSTTSDSEIEQNQVNNADYWSYQGFKLHMAGKYKEAIECFDKVIELDSNDALAWYNKGNAFAAQGMFEAAAGCYEKATKIDPKLNLAWENKAHALKELGRNSEAEAAFAKAAELANK